MEASKTYAYDWEQYQEQKKGPATMIQEILADPELPNLKELIVGSWGWASEDSCQPLIDGIIEHKDRFSNIESLFLGDMDYEECEVSWIIQGNYSRLWEAMPQLKSLTIKGSTDLELGTICHEDLESLTIICGGLPSTVIKSIETAKLPHLKKLLLYIGVENYGFDGNAETIRTLLSQADFPSLEYLGIADSEIQDELAAVVLDSKYMKQITTLDLSCGSLTDAGGELILQKLPSYPNVKALDLHYHYLSDDMTRKLRRLPVEIDLSEQNSPEEYDGEIWMNAMLTE